MVVEEQGVNLDIDSNKLEEVVSDEQACFGHIPIYV